MEYYKVDKSKPVKLDLGSGLNLYKGINNDELEQWIHQDGDKAYHVEIVCDWRDIPLESGVVDEFHSSDTIEHIPPWDKDVILKEWNRIMKIGCKVHLATPNFNFSCIQYATGKMTLQEAQQNLYGDRAGFYHVHYETYTVETLTETLEKYGFGELDFSESPGFPGTVWWIVVHCKKVRNV